MPDSDPSGDATARIGHIDTSVPHAARFWNYLLGGKDNYAPDREIGDQMKTEFPEMVNIARSSRRFLVRAVRYLVEQRGVRQFLDVGTGLPTTDNTHEVAQRHAPECRIVYVDNDPLVLAHARALLTSSPEGATDYVDADVNEPEQIHEAAARTLDFQQPIALVLMGVMGYVTEDADVHDLVQRLLAPLPAGSFLLYYDGTATSDEMLRAQVEYNTSGAVPYHLRRPEQIRAVFDGTALVEPGVVPVTLWRPELGGPLDGPRDVDAYGGIGEKS